MTAKGHLQYADPAWQARHRASTLYLSGDDTKPFAVLSSMLLDQQVP